MERAYGFPVDLPRPSWVCTGGEKYGHDFVIVYDRPWTRLWRKRYLRACVNRGCHEVRETDYWKGKA